MVVAVIGGGFSGSLLVTHLLAAADGPKQIYWCEQRPPYGRGAAYGTDCPAHLLNVAAPGMSAFVDAPQDFSSWLQAHHPQFAAGDLADCFAPRGVYRAYLQAKTAANPRVTHPRLVRVGDEVQDIERMGPRTDELKLVLRDTTPIHCNQVALCIGNFRARVPAALRQHVLPPTHYIADPWDTQAIAAIAPHARVAILGAGLTMVDVVLQLHAQGFAGKLTSVSRRGLWPRVHATQSSGIHLSPPAPLTATATQLLAWLRQTLAAHQANGGDWRQVIDAMRPHNKRLWQSLAPKEQARLLRHGKSLWDVHRHRVAPQVGRILTELRREGRLHHHAGRLRQANVVGRPGGSHELLLHWQLRQQDEFWPQRVDVLVNCTGAHNDWRVAREPLAQALLARRLVSPGPHDMGLSVSDDGAVRSADGGTDGALWAMGPARLGHDFESIAVPELRQQASDLARVMRR